MSIDRSTVHTPDAQGRRTFKVGPNAYDTSIPSGGPDSAYLIADKTNTENDASLLLRCSGVQKAEIGLPGDDDLHFKTVTGDTDNDLTFTDAIICQNATGLVAIPQGLGIGTVPSEKLHVVDDTPAARLIAKLENTASSGSGSAGFLLAGGGKTWYIVSDAGMNGGDNLGIMSDTAGWPPRITITPTAVGVGTDTPAEALDVDGCLALRNSATPPTPAGGGVLFVQTGALKYLGSSGTVTTIAPA